MYSAIIFLRENFRLKSGGLEKFTISFLKKISFLHVHYENSRTCLVNHRIKFLVFLVWGMSYYFVGVFFFPLSTKVTIVIIGAGGSLSAVEFSIFD